jgi:hypothetical protein
MKIYKNTNNIGMFFSLIFVIFIIIVLIINVVDEIKYKDFVNIKYYIIILIILIYAMICLFTNYYGKIYITEKNFYLKGIIFKKKICYYEILEINKPNIITLNKIIILYPRDEHFFYELNKNYLNYYYNNIEYFNEVKELYANLLKIKHELNEKIKQNTKIRPRLSLLVPLYIWIFFLIFYFAEKKLYTKYSETKKILKKHIEKYKSKPNFA